MDIRDYLSDDGQALLALCSNFALPENARSEGLEPFKLSEWNQLARQIHDSDLQTPAGLQGQTADQLTKSLAVTPDLAERIVKLLERSGRLALELESLFSRGLWALTRMDQAYPNRLKKTLKHHAPTVLFGAGDVTLLQKGGLAVVGSRNIDEAGTRFAQEVGRKAAASVPVISGGARGTDRIAMTAALEAGGKSVGALPDSLERTVRQPDLRQLLLEGQLVLLTPYSPTAGFSIGAAMGRNKVIYGLADFAVIVSSDYQTGGTWAGATEALKNRWCPVFVRGSEDTPKGNQGLIKLGGVLLTEKDLAKAEDLPAWFKENFKPKPVERDLFD